MLEHFDPHANVAPLAQRDFLRCTRMLHDRTGIVIGAHRRDVISRIIAVKAHRLGLSDPGAYLDVLERAPDSEAWQAFVNACTVNHTAFFRERHHFERLSLFVQKRSAPILVWCCAAATGEEPYTIAMTLTESGHGRQTGACVWATDIDTAALEQAREGTYPRERVAAVQERYLKKYFQRGVASHSGKVRVKPELAAMVQFQTLNLLDPVWLYGGHCAPRFDAIFCRNTMIYFDKETQTKLLARFADVLKPDGLLFAGHSENFTWISRVFRPCGQTVYRLAQPKEVSS